MRKQNIIIFVIGAISSLAFAPVFFLPGILIGIAYLAYQVKISKGFKDSLYKGYIFGFGHFLIGLYWISIGVSVYIEEFWWAIPFALVGVPLILACFIALTCGFSSYFRNYEYYPFCFAIIWIFFEWVRSWIFTGFPWNLAGYSLSFSPLMIQTASLFGVYGLSFMVILISSLFTTWSKLKLKIAISYSVAAIIIVVIYGSLRLKANPTEFSNIQARLVQPCIKQSSKWDPNEFLNDLDSLIKLSSLNNSSDITIWSEAALTVPYGYPIIKAKIHSLIDNLDSVLITGGVTEEIEEGGNMKIYSTMQGIDKSGILFEYHKSHLVPFGEYVPLKNYIPIKKFTPGIIDYTPGQNRLVYLKKFDLKIRPLICYESIFPALTRALNTDADLIVNITNDTWYGNSSGPYQHLHTSIMRAVENGIPMVRVANSGISAAVDPVGRIINILQLNKVGFVDQILPKKIKNYTLYSKIGNISIFLLFILSIILYSVTSLLIKKYFHK